MVPVGGLVEAEVQWEERMVREQISHLLPDARWIGRPSKRADQETAEPGKVDLGQSATSQRLRAEAQTEFAARPRNQHGVRPDPTHWQQFVGRLIRGLRRTEMDMNLVRLGAAILHTGHV